MQKSSTFLSCFSSLSLLSSNVGVHGWNLTISGTWKCSPQNISCCHFVIFYNVTRMLHMKVWSQWLPFLPRVKVFEGLPFLRWSGSVDGPSKFFFLINIVFYALISRKLLETQSCILCRATVYIVVYFFLYAWTSLPSILTKDNFVHCIFVHKACSFVVVWCVWRCTGLFLGVNHRQNTLNSNDPSLQMLHFCTCLLWLSFVGKPFWTSH